MWPWAALYAAQVAIAMFVWSVLNEKGGGLLPAVCRNALFDSDCRSGEVKRGSKLIVI